MKAQVSLPQNSVNMFTVFCCLLVCFTAFSCCSAGSSFGFLSFIFLVHLRRLFKWAGHFKIAMDIYLYNSFLKARFSLMGNQSKEASRIFSF